MLYFNSSVCSDGACISVVFDCTVIRYFKNIFFFKKKSLWALNTSSAFISNFVLFIESAQPKAFH